MKLLCLTRSKMAGPAFLTLRSRGPLSRFVGGVTKAPRTTKVRKRTGMPAINPVGDAMNIAMVQFSPEPAATKEEVTIPGSETELFGCKAKEMGVRLCV